MVLDEPAVHLDHYAMRWMQIMRRVIILFIWVVVAGCDTTSHKANLPLINTKLNIGKQKEYIEKTKSLLKTEFDKSKPVFEETPFFPLPKKYKGDYAFALKNGYIPIGKDNWFYFVSHSWHEEGHKEHPEINDLSIGIDNNGNYYFSRQHVCGRYGFRVGSKKRFETLTEFFKKNPGWQPLVN